MGGDSSDPYPPPLRVSVAVIGTIGLGVALLLFGMTWAASPVDQIGGIDRWQAVVIALCLSAANLTISILIIQWYDRKYPEKGTDTGGE